MYATTKSRINKNGNQPLKINYNELKPEKENKTKIKMIKHAPVFVYDTWFSDHPEIWCCQKRCRTTMRSRQLWWHRHYLLIKRFDWIWMFREQTFVAAWTAFSVYVFATSVPSTLMDIPITVSHMNFSPIKYGPIEECFHLHSFFI